jgi:hypothetical protein
MKIKHLIYLSTLLFSLTVQADKRIYSTDSISNRQYDKPAFEMKWTQKRKNHDIRLLTDNVMIDS